MFHSFGTVQSNTCVPVGTSRSSSEISLCSSRSVSRKPSPVMLRQIGYSSAIKRIIAWPSAGASKPFCSCCAFKSFRPLSRSIVGIILVALNDDSLALGPLNPKRWIVPPHAPRVFRRISLCHLVEHFRIVLERLEPVSEIIRDIQHPVVFRG